MMAKSSGLGRHGFLDRPPEKGEPMQSSGRMRAQITTLIIATSLVQLANGFFGTFISLRVAMEGFGSTMAGLVLSSYFAGFTLAAPDLHIAGPALRAERPKARQQEAKRKAQIGAVPRSRRLP
jgi:hypothetical protein